MTAKIHHADLYGPRPAKYAALSSSSLESIVWQELDPSAPFYLFRPQNQDIRSEYEVGEKINIVFPTNTIGIVTGQDTKTFAFSSQEAESLADEAHLPHTMLRPILYKPFDQREAVYSSTLITRPRTEVMRHMHTGENLAIVFTRSTSSGQPYDHIFCARHGMLGRFFVDAACITYFAPMWLYPTEQEKAFGMERRANLAPAFLVELAGRVGETPTPEDVFHYAYAVFHAPTYRTRYAAFLKTDFPRLPLPPDADTFQALAARGAKLTALHLLEAPELKQHGITFPVSGDHGVKKMKREERYVPPTAGGQPGRVRLNDAEYFENVPPEAWEFQVGGYQPAFKWLDDRKGRALSGGDITHYRRMLAAMRETAALLPPVDAAFLRLLAANVTP